MKLNLRSGKYVLAVSGGVDSMVLLDLLSKQKGLELVVAHFDHGIRANSKLDALLVEKSAKKLGLPFELGHGRLGPKTSEAKARQARYSFLEGVRQKHKAKSVIMAHHQDDLLETAIINLLRGSGWRGLVAIKRNPKITRPLLDFSRKQILNYAKTYQVKWREDPSNDSQKYLRNQVRHQIMSQLKLTQRRELLKIIQATDKNAPNLQATTKFLSGFVKPMADINRREFSALPAQIAEELMCQWLAEANIETDKTTIRRLSLAVKAARGGSKHDIDGHWRLKIGQTVASFEKV